MLEAALVMLIVLSMFLSAIGVFDYISKGAMVSHLTDQFIHDQELKPFALQGATLRFADERIREVLPEILDSIESNIVAEFERERISASGYRIEAEFVTFAIDTLSGEPLQVIRYPSARIKLGTLNLPTDVGERLSFDLEYAAMLERGGNQYAIPSGLFGNMVGQGRFLPLTPVIAVRVAVSLDGSFTGSILNMLGVSENPMVYDLKAVTLRGEVG